MPEDGFVIQRQEEPTSAPSPATAEQDHVSESLVCPACGYDLRAIASDKCPECGLAIDRSEMSISRIPWEHRREIGRFRAFWRTTRLVMFHPKKFGAEINRPVDYRSARKFQLITTTLAWASAAAWAVAAIVIGLHTGDVHVPRDLGSWLQAAFIVACIVTAWLFLFLATGVASYWFHPRSLSVPRQNRAVALSYYACAALAWLFFPSVMFIPVAFVDSPPWQIQAAFAILAIVTELLLLFLLLDWYIVTSVLMGAVTHCPASRRWGFLLALPMMWYGCLLLACLLPATVLFVSLMILSFR
jgi:hypothetical protein